MKLLRVRKKSIKNKRTAGMPSVRLTREWKSALALALVGALALFAFAFRGILFGEQGVGTGDLETVAEEKVRHPLSGVVLEKEIELPRVYGVMVENHFDAWPQSGLDQAMLVIEAPVEARIPRLLAFFSEEQEVTKIGPVRSARPYYIDWNAPFGGVYAHVGGSPEALAILTGDDTIDINEFSNEWFFWRDEAREAPHNVYTSTALLSEALNRFVSRFGEQENQWESWVFKEDRKWEMGNGKGVTIEFAGDPYVIEWKYQTEENNYRRFQNGELHEMEDGALIHANNVVVMETDVQILDAVGRRRVRTVGEGQGIVLQDGRLIEATWKKSTRSSRLRFYDRESGEEIAMNAGKTWIEVVPSLEEDVEVE